MNLVRNSSIQLERSNMMYSLINRNIEYILENVPLSRHFEDYVWLKTQYALINVSENDEYRRKYARFWAMGPARLSQNFKDNYFSLLQNKKNNIPTIEEIVDLLSTDANGNFVGKIHFSFATKLLHMLESNKPVYDSRIHRFFFLAEIENNVGYEVKKQQYIQHYNYLERECTRILERGFLSHAIIFTREKYNLNQNVTDIKIIDSVLWATVKCLEQGNVEIRDIFFN